MPSLLIKQPSAFSCKLVRSAPRCSTNTPRAPAARRIVSTAAVQRDEDNTAAERTLQLSRRGLLVAAWVASAPFSKVEANAEAEGVEWPSVKADLENIILADPDKGPTLVRLAWHSSGTYDKMSNSGGSGLGTIRFKEELAHGGNAGLNKAVDWLEPIYQKHPQLSYADLYTLSGVVAIKALGGPNIPFRAGRVDAVTPDAVTPDGRLPNADSGPSGVDKKDSDHLRDIFYRMGFDDQEIVALSGAHALGRCHADASGYVGPWSGTPTVFNNVYYKLLLKAQWTYDESKPQYQYKDASGTLMMLPTDLALVEDESFKPYVELYAKDKAKFFDDFTAAFQKLEELGTTGLYTI